MKKFLLKTSLIIVIPFIIALCLDIIISNILKETKLFPVENEVWNDIYDSKAEAELIILGSSRAWVHFDTEIIDKNLNIKSYNLGEDGSNILQQYIRYKELISFNPLPKKVILAVDIYSFRDEKFPTYRFYPYVLGNFRILNHLSSLNIDGIDGIDEIIFYVPLIRYFNRTFIQRLFDNEKKALFRNKNYNKAFIFSNQYINLNKEGNLRIKGYRGLDVIWKNQDVKKFTFPIDSSKVSLMKKFITEMKNENIEIIMIYPPEYKEGQSLCQNRNKIISEFEKISNQFDLRLYNYSDSLISERKEFFYNNQHLNKRGAEIFTKDVTDLIKQNSKP